MAEYGPLTIMTEFDLHLFLVYQRYVILFWITNRANHYDQT